MYYYVLSYNKFIVLWTITVSKVISLSSVISDSIIDIKDLQIMYGRWTYLDSILNKLEMLFGNTIYDKVRLKNLPFRCKIQCTWLDLQLGFIV